MIPRVPNKLIPYVRLGDLVIRKRGIAVVVRPFITGNPRFTTTYFWTMYFWTDDPEQHYVSREMQISDILEHEIVR